MAKKKSAAWIAAMLAMALIFIRPEAAVSGAQQAMRMWFQGVAPALLPFLALMPLITGRDACAAYEKWFSPVMRGLFRLPGAAAPAVIAAMISGSPGGAAAICEVKSAGGISGREAARIALATAGVSPAWLVLGVGCGMLGSRAAGLKLAAVQAILQLILLKMLEKVEIQIAPLPMFETRKRSVASIWPAVETTLSVCGYMTVFAAFGSAASSFLGKKAGIALTAVLDLPTGAALITQNPFPGDAAALGCIIGFGGICIAAQNLDKLRSIGVRWREYLAVRCMAASLNALLCTFIANGSTKYSPQSPDFKNVYAVSLLAAALCALPGMFILTKTFFLTKASSENRVSKSTKNPTGGAQAESTSTRCCIDKNIQKN